MDKTRINLANPQELLELPGIDQAAINVVVRHRAEHGPISGAAELTQILGPQAVTPKLLAHIDFQPAEATAAEAPGA
jgi:DNA uptake protein ComE-like DNA-binding protein